MGFLVVLTLFVAMAWVALELMLPTSSVGRRLRRALRRLSRPAAREPDPFEVLRVQSRLEAVAHQIRAIEADPSVFARRHRLDAARAAYDDLLDEACGLAGVAVVGTGHRPHDDAERWREEQELAARGWSW